MNRTTHASLLGLLTLALALPAVAQVWPSKPVTVIIPTVAGGPIDSVSRSVADKLRERYGHPFVVENRPGAGGTIGATAVAKAAPDGYTIMFSIDPPIVVNPALLNPVPYDPVKDFAPVALVADGGDVAVFVPAESGAKTARQLADLMRAAPNSANYTTSGNGSPGHILAELFRREAKFDAQHVPQKGAPQALTDLLAARVAYAVLPVSLVRPHVLSGKVRALAVCADRRSPLMPEVPTVAEAGYPGFKGAHWWVIALAPAGTPKAITDSLNLEIRRIANSIVPVAWMTLKAPPIRSRNAMMRAPSRNPLIGASISHCGPSQTLSICW